MMIEFFYFRVNFPFKWATYSVSGDLLLCFGLLLHRPTSVQFKLVHRWP